MMLEQWSRNPREVSLQFLQQLNSEGSILEGAVRELRNAPPQVLMRLLEEEMTLEAQAQIWVVLYVFGIVACVLVATFAAVFVLPDWLRGRNGVFPVVAFYLALVAIIKGWAGRASKCWHTHSEQAREQLCAAIRAMRDPALVGLILEGKNYPVISEDGAMTDSEPCPSYCIALENLLPVLSDVERQDIAQRYGRIWTCLLREAQVSDVLKINILGLVEAWGTSEYTGAVKSLLHANPELELTFAAKRCLEALQQREAEAKKSAMLLRPSHANMPAPETLLRPVTLTEDIEPEQLLRASEP